MVIGDQNASNKVERRQRWAGRASSSDTKEYKGWQTLLRIKFLGLLYCY